MNNKDDIKGANVKIPPPLLVLCVMALATYLDSVYPFSISTDIIVKLIGACLGFLALLVIVVSFFTFRKKRTSIEPWKPTTSIVTNGVFNYSRNPIYVAFCCLQFAVALFINNLWMLVLITLSVLLLSRLVIVKEEQYLEDKFGDEYRAYKQRVRRWL